MPEILATIFWNIHYLDLTHTLEETFNTVVASWL